MELRFFHSVPFTGSILIAVCAFVAFGSFAGGRALNCLAALPGSSPSLSSPLLFVDPLPSTWTARSNAVHVTSNCKAYWVRLVFSVATQLASHQSLLTGSPTRNEGAHKSSAVCLPRWLNILHFSLSRWHAGDVSRVYQSESLAHRLLQRFALPSAPSQSSSSWQAPPLLREAFSDVLLPTYFISI